MTDRPVIICSECGERIIRGRRRATCIPERWARESLAGLMHIPGKDYHRACLEMIHRDEAERPAAAYDIVLEFVE